MIPSTSAFLESDFEIETQPTHTYKMNLESGSIRGYTDKLEAIKQAIYKMKIYLYGYLVAEKKEKILSQNIKLRELFRI